MPRNSTAPRAVLRPDEEVTRLIDKHRRMTWVPTGPGRKRIPGRLELIELLLRWVDDQCLRIGADHQPTVLVGERPSPERARRLYERVGVWGVYRDGVSRLVPARLWWVASSDMLELMHSPILPDEVWRALGPRLEPVCVDGEGEE